MAVPAPSHLFGVTAQDVYDTELKRLIPSVAAGDLLDDSISSAASRLTQELRRWDITPADITEADYADDYAWCWWTVAKGAAGQYLLVATGSRDAAEPLLIEFVDRVVSIRESPQGLTIYSPNNSANALRSHMDDLNSATRDALANRSLPSPANRVQWETL